MASFDVEYVGNTPGDIQTKLGKLSSQGRKRTNAALRKTAREIKEDLENTAPVDTGEYRNSWYIAPVAYDEVWIMNEADHAKFVMLPNSQMVGSPSADFPAQGILHGVKSRAKGHSESYKDNIIKELQDMIQGLKVK